MNPDRGRTPPFSTFKAAWRELIDALGGGSVVERAKITRVAHSLLSRYGLVHEPVFAPADVLFEVEHAVVAAGGEPAFLRAYADALGFVVVPKAAVEEPVQAIDQAAAPVMQAVGKAMMELGAALSDGVCTPAEAATVQPSVRRAAAEIHELDEALAARASRGRR